MGVEDHGILSPARSERPGRSLSAAAGAIGLPLKSHVRTMFQHNDYLYRQTAPRMKHITHQQTMIASPESAANSTAGPLQGCAWTPE